MIALLQRVSQASVQISGASVGQIESGLMVLVCAQREDTEGFAEKLIDRVVRYRVFSDDQGRMNRSLLDNVSESVNSQSGQPFGLLLVPQFTLAADTRSGLRPSFTPAAEPQLGRRLFEHFVARARDLIPNVQTGQFGADMQVSLTNDGPVTFWLQVPA